MDEGQDHGRIVEQLRERCGGLWPLLAQDDEAREHLAAHLAGAGLWQELLALTTGTDAWARARFAAEGNYDGYLADLELVRQWAETLPGGGWGIRVRCALLASSTAVPEDGGCDAEDSLAQMLHHLATRLPDGLKQEAFSASLALIRGMANESFADEDIDWMAKDLPPDMMDSALATVRGFRHPAARAFALGGLLPYLPAEQRLPVGREALDAAQQEDFAASRACALGNLAKGLPRELQGELLAAVAALADETYRVETLCELAPHLPDEVKGQALGIARGLADAEDRAGTLAILAEYLPGELQDEVGQELLAAAYEVEDDKRRLDTFATLTECLPDPLKTKAAREALAVMSKMEEAEGWDLHRLAECVPDALKGEVLAMARRLPDAGKRVAALSGIAPHLPPELRAEAIREAFREASGPDPGAVQSLDVCKLAEYLPDELKEQALALCCRGADEREWVRELECLAKYLPDTLMRRALGMARAMPDMRSRAEALAELAYYMPQLQTEAYAAVLAACEQDLRTDLVRVLVQEAWLLERLGGVPALADLLQAIVDSLAWWPLPKSRLEPEG